MYMNMDERSKKQIIINSVAKGVYEVIVILFLLFINHSHSIVGMQID